ncbi:MAG: hypothetical protein LUC41_04470 [Clostridiales bacterium]|nr:hypothetical protein [Clostridiales bacterium]
MDDNIVENSSLLELAGRTADIYDDFTESVRNMGSKLNSGKRSSKLGSSVVNWVGGSHVRTERDILCDKFLEDIQKHLELFESCLLGASGREQAEACGIVADLMTEPRPPQSDSTTNLMKRAMIGQVIPFLKYVDRDELVRIRDRMDAAYTKRQLLPVEKDVRKELERLITAC